MGNGVNVLRKIKENLIKNWDVKKSPDDRTFWKEIKSCLNYNKYYKEVL